MKRLMVVTAAAVVISVMPVLADDVKITIAPEVDTWVMSQDGLDVVYDGHVAVAPRYPVVSLWSRSRTPHGATSR